MGANRSFFSLSVPCGIAKNNTGSGEARKEGKVGNTLKVRSNYERKNLENMAVMGTRLATIVRLLC